MDYATRMAFRALVSGLRAGNRVGEQDVLAIVEAIQNAAGTAAERSRGQDRDLLMELASDICRDQGIGE